jgi:hypothetical protein
VGRRAGGVGSPEWAAWANGVAVRELDFHDTFLAAYYSDPGDNIPPVLAVAQHTGRSGTDLARGIAAEPAPVTTARRPERSMPAMTSCACSCGRTASGSG